VPGGSAKIRVKGVYGKPWSKMVGQKIEINPVLLRRLARTLVKAVVEEAKKDFAKQGRKPTPKGKPEGIPASDSFFDSFGYRILGKSTIVITSTWPWIHQITEGRDRYRMTWLTEANRIYQVPFPQPDGTVLVRMTPFRIADAWIHPGFARHTFLARGIRKGRKRMAEIVGKEALKELKKGDPSR
jgi:hypothetical protein